MAHEPYLPEKYVTLSEKELRKEYSRLRSIANKRLQRLGASEYSDTQIYKLNVERFKPLSKLGKRELAYSVADVARFIASPKSSLSERRKADRETIQRLKAAGYDVASNPAELRAFVDFMEYSRAVEANHIVGSDVIAELYRDELATGLTPEELRGRFDEWLTQQAAERRQNIALSDALNRILGK